MHQHCTVCTESQFVVILTSSAYVPCSDCTFVLWSLVLEQSWLFSQTLNEILNIKEVTYEIFVLSSIFILDFAKCNIEGYRERHL